MRRIVTSLLFLGLLSAAPSYAQKTKSVLGSEITTSYPDNTSGGITPLILRNTSNDFLSSWQQYPAYNAQIGITYTFLAADYGALVTFNNTNPIAVTLPTPTGSFGIGWNVFVRNTNSGLVTITPAGALINGAANITLAQSASVWIVSDGTNYQVWNNSTGTVSSVNMSVPGSIFSISGVPCTSTCAISMTTAGTSGGIPFFSSASALSSSNALTQFGILYGGGPAGSPASSASAVTGTLLRGGGLGSAPAFTSTPILGTSATTGGSLGFANGTSGTVTLSPSTGALGNSILSLPVATDTLIAKATTDTLTNKTFDTAAVGNVLKINGTQISANTGGSNTVVLNNTPLITVGISASVGGAIAFANGTSGTTTLSPSTGALGNSILTLPVATDTLVGKSTSDILSNKTLASPTVTSSFTATGLVTNADLAFSATSVNGVNCVLGSSCSVSATASSITVGTTSVLNATTAFIHQTLGGILSEINPALIYGSSVTGTVLRGGVSPAFVSTPTLGTAGSVGGSLAFANGTSGTTTLSPSTGALVSSILTLPVATDTLIGKATTDTLTNKTFNAGGATGNIFQVNGNTLSTVTGSGNNVPLTGATLSAVTGSTLSFFPSSASVAALDLPSQRLVGGVVIGSLSQTTGSITVNCGLRPFQTIYNNGNFTITAPIEDGSCILKTANQGSAGTISFSGFSVGTNTGDALSTVNGNKYMIFIYRINGDATYSVKSLQ